MKNFKPDGFLCLVFQYTKCNKKYFLAKAELKITNTKRRNDETKNNRRNKYDKTTKLEKCYQSRSSREHQKGNKQDLPAPSLCILFVLPRSHYTKHSLDWFRAAGRVGCIKHVTLRSCRSQNMWGLRTYSKTGRNRKSFSLWKNTSLLNQIEKDFFFLFVSL